MFFSVIFNRTSGRYYLKSEVKKQYKRNAIKSNTIIISFTRFKFYSKKTKRLNKIQLLLYTVILCLNFDDLQSPAKCSQSKRRICVRVFSNVRYGS